MFLWTKKRNEIILFENQGVKLEVNSTEETFINKMSKEEILNLFE